MAISIFDMFSIGIGPSSSHTVGPMRACRRFLDRIVRDHTPADVRRVKVELFGSLGATGRGHGTDRAVLLGLCGEDPETVDVDGIGARVQAIVEGKSLSLDGVHAIRFAPEQDLVFHKRRSLPGHPNGMRLTAFGEGGTPIVERIYYSVGGGFVVDETSAEADQIVADDTVLPHPFDSGASLLEQCRETGLCISTLMLRNETAWRPEAEVLERLRAIWGAMQASVDKGCRTEGILPGGLKVKRRAAALHRKLKARSDAPESLAAMDWVNLYALAVNEENAAGGRVVTAPTNGAAGVIPAVLHYYIHHTRGADEDGALRLLLTAGAIGTIYKTRASISGAEMGCQGEVGVACSMAAAGLAELMGGTPEQVEDAAEIGMEHNLGLTCDPVGGLVQVPCIERNAMGAVKAINAARLALTGSGDGKVSLDKVIETMRQTGMDMNRKYKETARGGLAVNIIEC